VAMAAAQVQPAPAREPPDRLGLAATPEDRPLHPAGQRARDHLEFGAEHVVDAKVAGQGADLIAGGRRGDGDGVALLLVRAHQPARLGKAAAGDPLDEETFTGLRHGGFVASGERPDSSCDYRLLFGPPQSDVEPGSEEVHHLDRRDLQAPQLLLGDDGCRVAGDQGAVEVEEGSEPRPGWARGDLGENTMVVVQPGSPCFRSASASWRILSRRRMVVDSSAAKARRRSASWSLPAVVSPRLAASCRAFPNSSFEIASGLWIRCCIRNWRPLARHSTGNAPSSVSPRA